MNTLNIWEKGEFSKVRIFDIDGEAWFVGKDICEYFNDKNHNRTLSRVDDCDKQTIELKDRMGRNQKAIAVNESGMYSILFGMQPQKANNGGDSNAYPIEVQERIEKLARFKHWVTSEVLPSIRRTGSYQKPMTPEQMMRIQLEMIDDVSGRVTKLENTMNIDYGQQRVLEKEVASVVIESLGGKDSNAYRKIAKKVFSECNRDVKDYFRVNSRNNIPRLRFEDAVDYIRNWMPCSNTRMLIKEHNER